MKTQARAPILRLALCFGAGIYLSPYLSSTYVYLLLFLLMLFGILLAIVQKFTSRQYEWAVSFTTSLLFLYLGAGFHLAHSFSPIKEKLAFLECKESVLAGKVISPRKKTPYGFQAWVELSAYKRDSSWARARGKFQLYIKPELDSLFKQGDELVLKAYIKPVLKIRNTYHDYLLKKKIRHFAYAKTIKVLPQAGNLNLRMSALQRTLSEKMSNQIEDTVLLSLAQAMFLGNKRGLAKETRAIFASAGLSHMLAISGMHVGIIFICMSLLLLPFNLIRYGKQIKQACLLLLLLAYMLLTGASPAVVRAVLMIATVLFCRMLYQRYNLLNLLALSAWIQMLFDPEIVFQVGFQLSYAAVLGLLTLMPLYQKFTETPYKWLNILNGWVGVSIIATCCTAPLSIYYFEQFPAYFLFSNILASTVAFGLILSGFLWIICLGIPYVSDLLAAICEFFLWVLHMVASEVSQLPFALIGEWNWRHPGFQIVLVEIFFAILLICLPHLYARMQVNST